MLAVQTFTIPPAALPSVPPLPSGLLRTRSKRKAKRLRVYSHFAKKNRARAFTCVCVLISLQHVEVLRNAAMTRWDPLACRLHPLMVPLREVLGDNVLLRSEIGANEAPTKRKSASKTQRKRHRCLDKKAMTAMLYSTSNKGEKNDVKNLFYP